MEAVFGGDWNAEKTLPVLPSTPKCLQYKKKFLRGINFVKFSQKNTFQATRLPEERMGVTEKIGGRNEFP